MPLQQIRDFNLAIIEEFQGYGYNVVGQENVSKLHFSRGSLAKFYDDHKLSEVTAFIWLSQVRFAIIANGRRDDGYDMRGSYSIGWLYFPGILGRNAEAAVVGQAMVARLREGQAVTLTPATARALKVELVSKPPMNCTAILRLALWLLIHWVLCFRSPVMIALQRNGHRAGLRHLQCKAVGKLFVARRYRKT
ncbi:MAG: hypothetical protein JWO45_1960 [Spartobacteria bacterium]|nr:hypothetical protein [Spartobacteria bacterium]